VVTRIESVEVKVQTREFFRTISIEWLGRLVLLTATALVREPRTKIIVHRKGAR
jgi:hypothetical protein